MFSRFRRRRKKPLADYGLWLLRIESIEYFDKIGVERLVLNAIWGAREILEENPALYGAILASGIRDRGTIDHAARAALEEYKANNLNYRKDPESKSARVSARIFGAIAYEQPFFDGNKRTGLLSGAIVAAMLGFELRDSAYSDLEEEVRQLSAKNATVEEVANWFLEKVLIPPRKKGVR